MSGLQKCNMFDWASSFYLAEQEFPDNNSVAQTVKKCVSVESSFKEHGEQMPDNSSLEHDWWN